MIATQLEHSSLFITTHVHARLQAHWQRWLVIEYLYTIDTAVCDVSISIMSLYTVYRYTLSLSIDNMHPDQPSYLSTWGQWAQSGPRAAVPSLWAVRAPKPTGLAGRIQLHAAQPEHYEYR